jgi:hypothetical protein
MPLQFRGLEGHACKDGEGAFISVAREDLMGDNIDAIPAKVRINCNGWHSTAGMPEIYR